METIPPKDIKNPDGTYPVASIKIEYASGNTVSCDNIPEHLVNEFTKKVYDHIQARKRLPTIEELQKEWREFGLSKNPDGTYQAGCVYSGISYFGEHIVTPEEHYAFIKSKFMAKRIRKAEQEMGHSVDWCASTEKHYAFHNSRHRFNRFDTRVEAQGYGGEYFATEQGVALYCEAMGDDLKYLLS